MSREDFGTIIQIGDILVSEDVVCEYFACDYEVCRGECCVAGDSGAPVQENELDALERGFSEYSPLMGRSGLEAVDRNGFFVLDRDGDLVTPLCTDSPACAYAHFTEDGSCLCAIEKSGCRKPVSCSLYPVRVTVLTGGSLALNLHRWNICRCAFEKGRREGIRAYQFLRKPLIDEFGEEFYEALCTAAGHVISEKR